MTEDFPTLRKIFLKSINWQLFLVNFVEQMSKISLKSTMKENLYTVGHKWSTTRFKILV